jgi:tetratricopeptide (TPR) repeat protein
MNMRRNEPCFCGSGKRYKNCHGALTAGAVPDEPAADQRADAGPPRASVADQKVVEASLLHEAGQLERARELYESALADAPGHIDALTGLGALHARQRNLAAAERCLRQALSIDAESQEANAYLAAVLCDRGNAAESLPFFDRVLAADPDAAEILNNRGCALAQLGRHAEALRDFRRAAAITPEAPGLLANLGNSLTEVGELESALDCFDRALRGSATHIAALVGRSDVLNRLKRYPEAHACADTAVNLAPDSVKALNNRGMALRGLGRVEEALASFERALALNPDSAEAHYIRGNALQELGRHEEALADYERALAIKPDFVEALFGLGNALRDLRRRDEALAAFERALALKPGYADVHVNAGLCRLQAGDFKQGWRDYEWRWQSEYLALPKLELDKPVWDGKRPDGTLLAWGEQGLGDQILYLGMLPELAARARRLIVAIEPRLVPLAQRSFPSVEIVPLPEASKRRDFDCQVPLGSIGAHLRRSWDDFPRDRLAYLRADPVRSRQLREGLAGEGRLVCGLSWFSTSVRVRAHKSIRLAELQGMMSIPGVRFVDLQYGDTGAERAALREAGLELAHVDAVDNLNDIDGVAALIDACDLVITVSNTTAHLAGALGKRVFVMLPYAQGRLWYWHEGRADSPWYPSARLLRQPAMGDWASVIESATRNLKERLSNA